MALVVGLLSNGKPPDTNVHCVCLHYIQSPTFVVPFLNISACFGCSLFLFLPFCFFVFSGFFSFLYWFARMIFTCVLCVKMPPPWSIILYIYLYLLWHTGHWHRGPNRGCRNRRGVDMNNEWIFLFGSLNSVGQKKKTELVFDVYTRQASSSIRKWLAVSGC